MPTLFNDVQPEVPIAREVWATSLAIVRSRRNASDFDVLRDWGEAIGPFVHLSEVELREPIRILGLPIVHRLRGRGHSLADAVWLMREVIKVRRQDHESRP